MQGIEAGGFVNASFTQIGENGALKILPLTKCYGVRNSGHLANFYTSSFCNPDSNVFFIMVHSVLKPSLFLNSPSVAPFIVSHIMQSGPLSS